MTDWNATRRAQGQADVLLNDEGHRQAQEVATRLDDRDIVAVYASDLSRAVETARPVAEARGLVVETDDAFSEIDQGEWTGLSIDEIAQRWPERWGPARHFSARPGGETPAQVRARALEGLRRVVEAHPEGTLVIVSHGGTIRWLVAEALGLDDHGSQHIVGLPNGGVVSLDARLIDGSLLLGRVVRLDGLAPAESADPNV